MNTIDYLKEVYGYGVPIFLKDLRIGKKSQTSIRKDLSRAVQKGDIVRESHGVYFFDSKKDFPSNISFNEIVELRFIKNDYDIPGLNLDVYGYYTGLTFLNQIGLSQQVPAVIEICTNKTSCHRIFRCNGYRAEIKKGKIEINRYNYKALQFFDLFYLIGKEDIKKNYKLLNDYILKNLTKTDFEKYVGLYPNRILKLIVESGLIYAFR